jgi:hypothetical protein
LLNVQNLLNDPKYNIENKSVAQAVAPNYIQWLDSFSNDQLKAKNQDSRMLSDLKYMIQDGLQGKSSESNTSQILNDFNQVTAPVKSNYDTSILQNNKSLLPTRLEKIQEALGIAKQFSPQNRIISQIPSQ